jgi:STE24 endopeptidase
MLPSSLANDQNTAYVKTIMTVLLFTTYLAILAVGYGLTCLNLLHLKRYGGTVPPELTGAVAPDVLQRMSNYTLEMTRLGMAESSSGTE